MLVSWDGDIDDLTILEIINLVTVGITSYNFHNHVASDIGIDQLFVPTENLKTQTHTNKIHEWTVQNKMKLNNAKTKRKILISEETALHTHAVFTNIT